MSGIKNEEKILPDEQAFWLKKNDTTPLARVNSIREMIKALKKCPSHVVAHHLREGINDFANWVRDCFQDETLAKELEKIERSPNINMMHSKVRIAFENALNRGTALKSPKPAVMTRAVKKQ